MIKVLIVFGTRPEAIKMAPLVRALKHPDQQAYFDARVCVTGQHRQMLDQVMEVFGIVPEYDLNIMKAGQDLFDITSAVLLGMRSVLDTFKPDLVLVHGDTGTSTAAALAAFYRQVEVGHVEAGLRTYQRYSPWPEEMNRQLTGRLADLHFAPTEWAADNLRREQVAEKSIHITGNTVIDALKIAGAELQKGGPLLQGVLSVLQQHIPNTANLVEAGRYVLVTGHRRENFGKGFEEICASIREVAETHPGWQVIYPVHLNPNVQQPVNALLKDLPNVYLIPPLEYLPFVYLMQHCAFVLTDSGGIQEEAPGLGKPVLVMRDTTERPEAVEAGTVKLVGTRRDEIVHWCKRLMNEPEVYESMSSARNPYGEGQAAQNIVDILRKHYR
jgi:UDP-N-acetylglucosamine 2-epimerase (non-hydrolysing)